MIKYLKMYFSEPTAKKLLLILLAIDLIFICIHLGIGVLFSQGIITDYNDYAYLLVTRDQNFPEFFQYLKYLMVINALFVLSKEYKNILYLGWIFLFIFLLLDDSLMLHERVGEFLAETFHLTPGFGLRAVDYGELLYASVGGVIILASLYWTFIKGDIAFKRSSLDLLLLIGLFLFFGIGVDMVHIMLDKNVNVKFVLGLFEDGSEMIVLSVITWYTLFIVFKSRDQERYFYQFFFPKLLKG